MGRGFHVAFAVGHLLMSFIYREIVYVANVMLIVQDGLEQAVRKVFQERRAA